MKEFIDVDSDLYEEIGVEKEDVGSSVMEEPFNPSLIDIDTKSPTLSLLIERLEANPSEIDLYPGFQRKDNLWSEGDQSRLIESILINFPLPAFYFDATDDNRWLVVDGLQRLSCLRNFVIYKSLKLTGLEFLKDLEGIGFDKLSRAHQRKIKETQIVAYLIKPGTPPKVKYHIFKRLNIGGLVLTSQEIRYALNQGIAADFIAELAELDVFKRATGYKIPSTRMEDREFITRFVAFYINDPKDYTPDLDSFLNDSMALLAALKKDEREDIRLRFISAMELAYLIFADWAFRKTDSYPDRKKPINKALFEVWAVNIAKLTTVEREAIKTKKDDIFNRYVTLSKESTAFRESISASTGDKQRVLSRFGAIEQLLEGVLDD